MLFYSTVIISVLIPLIFSNKKWGLRISLIVLFCLLGFQYELVNDWESNIVRWYYVNEGGSRTATGFELEPFFVWLMKVAKPITFFGWLISTAAVFLSIIYYYTRRFVPQKYYWLTIFALMSDVSYGLLFINSNRQCISICFVLIGVLFLLSDYRFKFKIPFVKVEWTKYIIAAVFFFIGSQCHSAAYISFLLLPIWIIANRYEGNQWLLLAVFCNILYFARPFIDMSWIQEYVSIFISVSDVGNVEGYFEYLDTNDGATSLSSALTNFAIITIICYFYRQLSHTNKFFAISWFFGFLISTYFTGNVNRLGEYFYIFFVFLIPNILYKVINANNILAKKLGVLAFTIFIGVNSIHCYTQMQSKLYVRWLDYKSVFDAPKWE